MIFFQTRHGKILIWQKFLKRESPNLTEEFGSKDLELLKQKDAFPYECIDSFKRFNEEKLPDKKYFYRSATDGTTSDNGKN